MYPPTNGVIGTAINNANNEPASAKANRLGVLSREIEVERDSAELMSSPLAGDRGSEREVILT